MKAKNNWGERMKKILILSMIALSLILSGCGKNSADDALKNFTKKTETDSYKVEGKLELTNNEDTYNYDVTAAYQKEDKYRVSLKNIANNHEQVILRNTDGVYVLTPSLNKSFKFQSEWPANSSQIYLLGSIANDLKNDKDKTVSEKDGMFIYDVKANYPNNSNLVKQKIAIDPNGNIKSVEVVDDNGTRQMYMVFNNIDYKAKFDNNYFNLDEIMKNVSVENEAPSGSLDDIIYPLYLPTGTVLKEQDKVEKTNGERVILSFDGEKPFLLVEETANIEDEFTIIPTFGEPHLLVDTVGALTDNSLSWTSNGIDYYIVRDVMNKIELLEIARSISVIPTMSQK